MYTFLLKICLFLYIYTCIQVAIQKTTYHYVVYVNVFYFIILMYVNQYSSCMGLCNMIERHNYGCYWGNKIGPELLILQQLLYLWSYRLVLQNITADEYFENDFKKKVEADTQCTKINGNGYVCLYYLKSGGYPLRKEFTLIGNTSLSKVDCGWQISLGQDDRFPSTSDSFSEMNDNCFLLA